MWAHTCRSTSSADSQSGCSAVWQEAAWAGSAKVVRQAAAWTGLHGLEVHAGAVLESTRQTRPTSAWAPPRSLTMQAVEFARGVMDHPRAGPTGRFRSQTAIHSDNI